MISSIISRLVILLFGTLYPAYASYKAVRTKNVKEYVKWMMYWIVFALFTCAETFTDVFLSWFPFYYEIKIILVIWLLSPATKGSSILYRKFVHPMLSSREQEIDEYISKAKEQSYKQVLEIGSKGVNALMQTALKGGGGLVNQLRKSYSLSDLSDKHEREVEESDEADSVITDSRLKRRKHSPRRMTTTSTSLYFSEIDVRAESFPTRPTAEDISSGYSSGDVLHTGQVPKVQPREPLIRTASVGSRARPTRVTRSSGIHPKNVDGLNDTNLNNIDANIILINDEAVNISSMENNDSSSEGEFLDSIEMPVNNEVSISSNTIEFSKPNKEDNVQPLTIGQEVITNLNDPIKHDEIKQLSDLPNNTINENNVSEDVLKLDNPDKEIPNQETEQISANANTQVKSNDNAFEGTLQDQSDKNVIRCGKYKKKHAPAPPLHSNIKDPGNILCKEIPTIKATLVLKPGLVRSVESLSDISTKSEIFITSPTRPKRRSNKPNSSAMSKFLTLPKKIGLWPKNDSNKRNSWHNMSSLSVTNLSKEKSKSDDFARWHRAYISLQEGKTDEKE